MSTTTRRDDWVSWFVNGRAVHVPADSTAGVRIRVALAELAAGSRRCSAPDCDRPIHGRADRQYCTDACAKTASRSRKKARIRGRSKGEGVDLPDTPLVPTTPDPSPQVDGHPAEPIIVDTADTSGRPERRCANCGEDITKKRAGAVVCGDTCRKAIARRARTIAGQADLFELLGQTPTEAKR